MDNGDGLLHTHLCSELRHADSTEERRLMPKGHGGLLLSLGGHGGLFLIIDGSVLWLIDCSAAAIDQWASVCSPDSKSDCLGEACVHAKPLTPSYKLVGQALRYFVIDISHDVVLQIVHEPHKREKISSMSL